ncbi:MAG TPA: tetratricopeptide repeat protein, partial [Gemmataceae bacterium]|nr:tetratricopeptide repeat protein [Gemmataceae bacterium]
MDIDEKAVFLTALALPDAKERKAYLQEACAGHPEVLGHLQELLLAHEESQGPLDRRPAVLGATVDAAHTETPGTVIGPYKLLQQIGEGGMGTVFMAEQTQPVQRKVALKLIKPGMDIRQVIARFEAERQALALMDHVNIARVFDGGATENGRPYFVMELVHGVPITKYCDDNHLTPRERLELFVPVCQAIQHAHQKGIIHRDVKPSNVMVTLYDGKPVPKVIDFGVAKATEQKLTERTLFTQYGTMVGTFEYMSPEQAEMSALGVDTRSDIYSLGVLLYELLTGSTPLTHKRMKEAAYAEILRMIKEEEPQKPSTRLSDSGEALASISAQRHMEPAKLTKLVRGELDWIVMKALEKDRNRRYETANGFAMDVQRYLADEPVQACPPSAVYRFRKFARRNKTRLAVAGLALFFLIVLGSGIGWTIGDRAARHASSAKRFDDALAQAAAYMQAENWPEAKAAAQRAADLLNSAGGDSLREERLRQVEVDLDMVTKLESARLQRTAISDDDFQSDPAYMEAFRDYNLPVKDLEPGEAARRIATSAIREQILAALYDWDWVLALKGAAAEHQKLAALIRLADSDPWRRQLYDLLDRKDIVGLVHLSQQPGALGQSPARLLALGINLGRTDLPAEVIFLRRAQQRYPDDFWINNALALDLGTMKQLNEAIGFHRVAVALRPKSPGAYVNLGVALKINGQLDDAIAAYREAIRLKNDDYVAHSNLGSALCEKGQLDEAIAECREAIRLRSDFARAHGNLGNALTEKGQLDEGITEHRKAIQLKNDNSPAHNNLGNALFRKGQLDEAIAEYREALRIKRDNAYAHNGLACALMDKRQLDEAIGEFREAIRIKTDYANAHCNLSGALREKGQLDEAIAECREAIRLKSDFADAHCNLGEALRAKGQLDEAIAAHREAIRLKKDDYEAHCNLGCALADKRQWDEAIGEFREAIRIKTDCSLAHCNLGTALRAKGQLDEAIAEWREAIRLKKDYAEPHLSLGSSLMVKCQLDEAIAEFREAIRLKDSYAKAHAALGEALRVKGQLDEAIHECRKAIRLKKDDAWVHNVLGMALSDKPQMDEAIAAYREALRLKRDFFEAHYNLGDALRIEGQLDDAISEYREAIRLKSESPDAHCNLGLVLRIKGQLDEAVAEYREAIRLKKELAPAQFGLGQALELQGQFQQAVEHIRLGNKLGARVPGGPGAAAEVLHRAERMAALDARLPKILKREDRPVNAGEATAVAQLCQ